LKLLLAFELSDSNIVGLSDFLIPVTRNFRFSSSLATKSSDIKLDLLNFDFKYGLYLYCNAANAKLGNEQTR
jgi:hypothetical protein